MITKSVLQEMFKKILPIEGEKSPYIRPLGRINHSIIIAKQERKRGKNSILTK